MTKLQELHGYAAMFANLEGIGPGEMEATLEEIQSAGTSMLEILEGMESLFAQIEKSAQADTIDEAVRPIQDILGQDDGGNASMHFSGMDDDVWATLSRKERTRMLIRYVVYEMGMMEFAL